MEMYHGQEEKTSSGQRETVFCLVREQLYYSDKSIYGNDRTAGCTKPLRSPPLATYVTTPNPSLRTLLVLPSLASKPTIALPITILISPDTALTGARIEALPRVAECDRIRIDRASGDIDRVRKLAVYTSSLQAWNIKAIHPTNLGLKRVEDTKVELVVCANAFFVLLMLGDVESAGASGEARGKRVRGAGGCEGKQDCQDTEEV